MISHEQAFSEFNTAVNSAVKRFPDRALEIFRVLALKGLQKIVMRTPVDTGRARGNWQVGITPGSGARTLQFDASSGQRSGSGVGGRGKTSDLGTLVSKVNSIPLDRNVYIYNNVPYIVYLEDGSSRQAPYGMLRPTLIELTNELS